MRVLWSMAAGLAALNMIVGLFTVILPRQLSAMPALPSSGEAEIELAGCRDENYPARPCYECLLMHRWGACVQGMK